jgi:hypothetical protein
MFECTVIILVAVGLFALGTTLILALNRKQLREDAERKP